ncbi:MAG: hypothetical protein JWO43_231 [Candidatus Adlerbacteria bacterium]|nr:hypothetical protein [Candidatus Adlerbacteria bacterium]
MEGKAKCARDVWIGIREDKKTEGICEHRFREIFPHGHRQSLRPFLIACQDRLHRGKALPPYWKSSPVLTEMHPRAYELLIRYGRNYTPMKWERPPEIEPEFGQCYGNSFGLMGGLHHAGYPRTVYVEGVVFGAISYPMLHAWNALKGRKDRVAVDFTHYPTAHLARYIGIPLTQAEYARLLANTIRKDNWTIGLLHRRHFPAIENELYRIVRARKL